MARYHAHGPQAFGCGPLRSIVRGRENEPVSLYAGRLTLSSWSELHGSAIQPASDVMYRPIPRDGTTDQEGACTVRCNRVVDRSPKHRPLTSLYFGQRLRVDGQRLTVNARESRLPRNGITNESCRPA